MATTTQTQFGTYTHGKPSRGPSGSWFRMDQWKGVDGTTESTLHFAAGPDDDSPFHDRSTSYSANCSCCWLGFPHTQDCHASRLSK